MVRGGHLYYAKIWPKLANPFQNANFQSIFDRSASAVTPSEKSSVSTNRKSTTSFLMSLRWTVHVSPKLPEGAQKPKVSKIWTIICDNSETYELVCRVLSVGTDIGNLEWPWTVFNYNPYFSLSHRMDSFASQLRHIGWRQTYDVRKI